MKSKHWIYLILLFISSYLIYYLYGTTGLIIALIAFLPIVVIDYCQPKLEKRRRKKIHKLLALKYTTVKTIDSEKLEVSYRDYTVRFEFNLDRSYNGFLCYDNILNIYIEITDLEARIKDLCKIHFHHFLKDNKNYLNAPRVFGWNNSLKALTEKSENRIINMIDDYEIYIEEKR